MCDAARESRTKEWTYLALAPAFLTLLSINDPAWSQVVPTQDSPVQQTVPAQPPVPPPANQPPANPPARGNPGLVEEIGRLLKESASGLSSTFKDSRDSIQDFNTRATDAATESLSKMGAQTMVNGRVTCPVAANGAPDCYAASNELCKQKGYKEGKSIDVVSAEKCSANAYISGRTGMPGECKTENFVTRAMCQ